ncbi:MAG: GxxExxY protein [Chthoniobacterales bacterium]
MSSRKNQQNNKELNVLSGQVIDAAYFIHSRLGPGLLESVYEVLLAKELEKRGLNVARQVPVPIEFEGVRFDEGFRADIILENALVIEVKSVENFAPVHGKQVLTYLKLLNFRLGLLLNFGALSSRQASSASRTTFNPLPYPRQILGPPRISHAETPNHREGFRSAPVPKLLDISLRLRDSA